MITYQKYDVTQKIGGADYRIFVATGTMAEMHRKYDMRVIGSAPKDLGIVTISFVHRGRKDVRELTRHLAFSENERAAERKHDKTIEELYQFAKGFEKHLDVWHMTAFKKVG